MRVDHGNYFTLQTAAMLAGWSTPTGQDAKNAAGPSQWARNMWPLNVQAASVTGWPTPRCEDSESTGAHRGVPDTLTSAARLCGWPTPNATTGGPESRASKDRRGSGGIDLQTTVELVGWPTPNAMEGGATSQGGDRKCELLMGGLVQECRVVSGTPSTSLNAVTEKRGALNPAHSRWLMGFPPAWDDCAVTAMQSCPRKPRRSSKRTSKQEEKRE